MSEEQNVETNDGTWSGLKKTIIGALTTLVTAGGVWISTQLFGGKEEASEPHPVQQAAPVINITNSNEQQQSAAAGGTTKIIEREKVVEKEKPAPAKKKEGDEFKQEAPKW